MIWAPYPAIIIIMSFTIKVPPEFSQDSKYLPILKTNTIILVSAKKKWIWYLLTTSYVGTYRILSKIQIQSFTSFQSVRKQLVRNKTEEIAFPSRLHIAQFQFFINPHFRVNFSKACNFKSIENTSMKLSVLYLKYWELCSVTITFISLLIITEKVVKKAKIRFLDSFLLE